ncbi:T-cell surface glycoprotein CD1b4 precursor [Cavia porcellus]|uniref:T-cell surface glycoprotein CD1b4 n=1 Tax=Cavia porcellus TaxID=10141 RepID=CD1B4_CAVPO|nr:T-cell surface glycoprotein CD1b4 precursor [Cavia porcellus]Q9QZY9.1 RecName: Full=T-cell surface glycoprotein CD1b4; AltName: CD_antigen=CD1b-4; Flags: Precursor [Cavia porcellus]AAF12741.1 CD1-B4 [Cavia porcellus]
MLLLALAFFFPAGDTQNVLPGKISFYGIQISTFFNHTVVENRGSGWLGDMEISSWDSEKETIIFRKPWSKGNFSNDEILEVEEIFQVYFFGFVREAQKHMSDFQVEYPFEIQVISGCEVNSHRSFDYFMRVAVKGLDLLSIKNHSCWPAPEGVSRAQEIWTLILQYKRICDTVEILLTKTCPRYLMSVIEAGKSDLQKQVKPDAWLSQGPSPGPGLLQLVCHVSGFYPKPVWVMWMRGDKELPETQKRDVLPNADETWYLRVTLDVAAEEAAGLSCRVKHSSLEGQDIILYWGHSISIGWIILAVLVPCLIVLVLFILWFYRRWSYEDIF